MEDIPQITGDRVRFSLDIPVQSCLRDHHVEGKAVLPAVEAMKLLGETVRRFQPEAKIRCMTQVRFEKFLYIPPNEKKICAFVDIEINPGKDISARLMTKTSSRKTPITRTKEHAAIRYPQRDANIPAAPLDLNSAVEGICFTVSAADIYRELVPLGPEYQNIKAPLILSENGGLANVGAPLNRRVSDVSKILGSPFPLDAAFHAACVWGQRYMGTVTFPVGLESRTVYNPTRPGDLYFSRILPVRQEPGQQVVDIWIYDAGGTLYEQIGGAHMRDVSKGRLKPPRWLIENERPKLLPHITPRCSALSVIELGALMPFAEKTLASREKKRIQNMGPKRKPSYLAARLACKRISRVLSGNDTHTPATDIVTVGVDYHHPRCPPTDCSIDPCCSVSHDDRFAVAVAAERLVGIDVEKASPRVLKSQNLYMSAAEQALVDSSGLGDIQTAVRIWSAKEAAAKALDISLADTWRRVRLLGIGRNKSFAQIDGKDYFFVFHDEVDRHVFSLACLPVKITEG